jgi:hypothetical protein
VIILDMHLHNPINVAASDIKSRLAETKLLAISVWIDEETKVTAESFAALDC